MRAPNRIDRGTMIVVSRMSEPMKQIKGNEMNDKPEALLPPGRREARSAPTIAQSAPGSM